MSYYREPDSHIRDKVKVVVLNLSNYVMLDHATGFKLLKRFCCFESRN